VEKSISKLLSAIKDFSDSVVVATMDDVVTIELTARSFDKLAEEMFACGGYDEPPTSPTKVYGTIVIRGHASDITVARGHASNG